MVKKISRRFFLKKGTRLTCLALLGNSVLPYIGRGASNSALSAEKVDITVIKGADYFNNTIKAVNVLGGMGKFVPRNSKVGILVNSPFDKPGTYVKPEIVLAVIKMCYDIGAKEIVLLRNAPQKYWNRSSLSKQYSDEIKSLKSIGDNFVKVAISQGKKLKEASVVKTLLECDIFINIPKTKDHEGTKLTGTMKNMMGATSRSTNGFFHFGSNGKSPYEDVEFLSQCIADLNLVRRPNLCIADATELITTNGPFGPGKIIKPQQVIAGIDGIAVDSYCATILGFQGHEIKMLKQGYEHGLGALDLDKLHIKKVTVSSDHEKY
jgi:uncharacterized protein (DUF362 family)